MSEHKCKCAGCTKSKTAERARLIAIVEEEIATYTRETSFSYPRALEGLIVKFKEEQK